MTPPSPDLESIWSEVERQPVPPAQEILLRDAVTLPDGKKVMLGKDAERRLHLCVETSTAEIGLGDSASKGIAISCEKLIQGGRYLPFVDVVCLTPDLAPLFKIVANDMVDRLLRPGAGRFKTCHQTLEHWRNLINRRRSAELSAQGLASILAELLVLERLTLNNPAALAMWRGPKKALHDFVCGAIDIEVKSSLRTTETIIEVNDLKQLDPPTGGSLYLSFFRLEETPGRGTSVPDILERLLSRGVDSEQLYSSLKDVGYDTVHSDAYSKIRFEVKEELLYEVADSFPRLSSKAFAPGQPPPQVTKIGYSLNLVGVPANATTRKDQVFDDASRGVRA